MRSPMVSASLAERVSITLVTSPTRLSSAATTSLPFSASVLEISTMRADSASVRLRAVVDRLLEAGKALVERGRDLVGLGGDAIVESVDIAAHRLGDVLRARAKPLDELGAVGLHGAVEFGEMPSDE